MKKENSKVNITSLYEYYNYSTENKNHQDKHFKVDGLSTWQGHRFEGCIFYFDYDSTEVIFASCELTNCFFLSVENDKSDQKRYNQKITINKSELVNISLKGVFNAIQISNCPKIEIFNDYSICKTSYHLTSSKVRDFRISGECDTLNILKSDFTASPLTLSFPYKIHSYILNYLPKIFIRLYKLLLSKSTNNALATDSVLGSKSVWLKEIKSTSIINDAHFRNVAVDPYYFSVTAEEKNRVNMTQATFIDSWLQLRKDYSGVRMYIVLLLSIMFFLPIITESFVLMSASKITPVNPMPDERNIENDTTKLYYPIKNWVDQKIRKKIRGWIPETKPMKLGHIIFLGKSDDAFYMFAHCALTLVLLFYNLSRIWMTFRIAKIREEERFLLDAGYSKVTPHNVKYSSLIEFSKWLRVILGISVIYACVKLLIALNIVVPVLAN